MNFNRPANAGNVVPFRTRSQGDRILKGEGRRDDIMRTLDLSKFERPRPPAENDETSIRANIAALVLLGLLVFIAAEDFSKLSRSNLCVTRSECLY
jgi:hypothetical protein